LTANNDFGLFDPCPECGSKTEWKPNIIRENFEFGKFVCTNCNAVSDWHEVETTSTNSDKLTKEEILYVFNAVSSLVEEAFEESAKRAPKIMEIIKELFGENVCMGSLAQCKPIVDIAIEEYERRYPEEVS